MNYKFHLRWEKYDFYFTYTAVLHGLRTLYSSTDFNFNAILHLSS